MRWIKDHTLAAADKTVRRPDQPRSWHEPRGNRKTGSKRWKSANLKRSSVACVMSDTWRRKIKLVPTRTECQKNWTCSATKLLSLSLKDRKKLHCFCDTARAFKSLPSKHTWPTTFALLLFNSINLPLGPLEAIMLSPPPSTRLPHHPQNEDRRKNFLLTTQLVCTHVGRWRARWLVSNWRLAQRAPHRPNEQARHSTGKIPARPPSFPPLWIISDRYMFICVSSYIIMYYM